jgi:MoaA/NifB/PqqE/SkfB family radical SAM enzyme
MAMANDKRCVIVQSSAGAPKSLWRCNVIDTRVEASSSREWRIGRLRSSRRITNMNGDRWQNISRARSAYVRRSATIDAYPIEAFFEVAARCNLRCQMCAINFDARYRGRGERPPFFAPDLFDRLKPIFPTLHRAFLFGLGEPVLNPHLVDYVRELSGHGVEACFNTNATLITDEKAAEIARAGATRVTVSIDGASRETYEAIRRGASFDDVIRGIRALVAARERFGNPEVDLSFVAMASNIRELPALIELSAALGTTAVHVEPLLAQVGSPELDQHYQHENLGTTAVADVAEVLEQASHLAKERGILFASRLLSAKHYEYVSEVRAQPAPDWTCSEPWASIWVTSSGEVRTCCINDTSFGNLFERSFEEIWNGEPFLRFRRQHADREVATGCANCMKNGRMRNSTFFRPTQPVSYRPYFARTPSPTTKDPVSLIHPTSHSTMIDSILVTGSLLARNEASTFEVMLGYTPVANLGCATFVDQTSFTMNLSLPYLTEGAHVIWIRRLGDCSDGWAHRDFYFWRPDHQSRRASPKPAESVDVE